MSTPVYDVAVIGGGIVGLATAMALTQRHTALSIIVIEAEDGVGTLLFDRRGRVSNVADAKITISPKDECPTGADLVRALTMTAAGQVHVTKEACGT